MALFVFAAMGNKIDWTGLPIICALYQMPLDDDLMQRLILINQRFPRGF